MSTLRDHGRAALARGEPNETEAARDLAALLARARRRRQGRVVALRVVPGLAVAAGAALYFAIASRAPSPPPARSSAVHLYLRVDGEPEARATVLDLDAHGDL
jgi:hypothetical protein